jgi:hypothetical protein
MPEIQDILASLPFVKPDFHTERWFSASNYYPYYEAVARILEPKCLLEIGSLLGFSLIAMLKGAKSLEEVVWGDNESDIGLSSQLCYENVQFYLDVYERINRQVLLRNFKDRDDLLQLQLMNKVDLIHIDGDRSFEDNLQDLKFCYGLSPAYMMLDDYHNKSAPEVRRAVDYWAASMQLEFFVIDTYYGLAFFDLSKSKKARELFENARLPIL